MCYVCGLLSAVLCGQLSGVCFKYVVSSYSAVTIIRRG